MLRRNRCPPNTEADLGRVREAIREGMAIMNQLQQNVNNWSQYLRWPLYAHIARNEINNIGRQIENIKSRIDSDILREQELMECKYVMLFLP